MKISLLVVSALVLCSNDVYSQCACCAGAGSALNTDNASGVFTLNKRQFAVEAVGDFRTIRIQESSGHDSGEGMAEETPLSSILLSSLGVKYGLTDRLTLSAMIPYAVLNTRMGNDKGLGDLMLLGTYNLIRKNNFNLALSAGVELPTGVEKGSAFDETTVVVGSGSYDPILSIAASQRWNKFALIGSAFHRQTTRGFGGTTYSSVSLQNVQLSYTLKGHGEACADSCAKHDFGWYLTTGYYGEWLGAIKTEDETDPNSGYYMGFATLGTAITLKAWTIPVTVSLPLFQNMNGDQNKAGYRLRLSIIRKF